MDKKLLVSLMMTAPVAAFGAVSHWTAAGEGLLSYSILPEVNEANWTANGLADFTTSGGTLVCPVASGFLSHNAFLPAGTYNFNCAGLSNALIQVNGKYLAKTNAEGKYVDAAGKVIADTEIEKMVPLASTTVTYKAGTTLYIKVVPQKSDVQFEVGKMSYELDFNFATAKAGLQSALDAVTLSSVTDADNRAEATLLRNRKKELETVAAGIQGNIDLIVLNDGEKLLAAYENFELIGWSATKPADKISKAIAEYAGDAKTYNDDVDAENTIWSNIQTNTAAKAALDQEVANLQVALNAKKAEIAGIDPEEGAVGEYCLFITDSDIKAAQKAIDDYKAAINEAYADLTKKVTFESQNTKISDQINAISYETAKADWNAYKTFLDDLNTVATAYGKIFSNIDTDIPEAFLPLAGGSEIDNVYYDVMGTAHADLEKAYGTNVGYVIDSEGGLTPDNKNIAGAAAKLAEAQQEIADRKAAMQKVYDDLKALKDAQDAALASAKTEVNSLDARYNELKKITGNTAFDGLKPADQKIVKDELAAIEAAINALKAGIDADYIAHKLDVNGTSYTTLVGKVNDAFTSYDNKTQGFSGVLELITLFEDAKSYVGSKTGTPSIAKYNLSSKFDNTFANIQSAIDKYYATPSATAQNDIKKSIADSKTMCDKLVASFQNAVSLLNDAQEALDSFNETIANKQVVKVDGKDAYNKAAYKYTYQNDGEKTLTAAGVAAAISGYEAELNNIATGNDAKYANPNDAYAAANNVSDEITADNYAKYVAAAEADFVQVVTDANLAAVKKVADNISEKKNTAPYKDYAGMSTVDDELELPEGYKGPKNVTEAAADVSAVLGNPEGLAKCDSNLQVLADAYDKVNAEIKKIVANHDAYVTLTGAAATAQTALTNAINSVDDKTYDPAATYYKDEFNKLQTELYNINTAVTKSYNAITEVADQATHNAAITALKNKVRNLEEAMVKNQQAYDEQLEASRNLANDINKLVDWLNANDDVPANRDKYLTQIDGVKDQLAAINVDITTEFGKGNSVNTNVEERIDELRTELQTIWNEETTGYKGAVEAANADYIKAQGVVEGGLDKQYKDAIDWVNQYRYDISNPGYYTKLTTDPIFQQNHNELQQCYKAIQDLEGALSAYVDGLTAGTDRENWIVLTNNNVDVDGVTLQSLVEESNRLKLIITSTLTALDNAAKTVADNYYAEQLNGNGNGVVGAQTIYDNIKNRLVAAGFSADKTVDGKVVLGEVSNAMTDLTKDLNAATTADAKLVAAINAAAQGSDAYNNAVHAYILEMSGICDNLDKINAVNQNNFVKEAVNSQWSENYKAAVNAINGYIAAAAGYTQDPNNAACKAALQGYLEDVQDLDAEWSALNTAQREAQFGLFDNSNTTHDNLEDLVADAKTAVDASKAAHENAIANSEALKVLITNSDSYLNKTEADLAALLAWSGYRDSQIATVDALQTSINNVKSKVERDNNVNANLDTYKTDFTNLQNRIEAAYATVWGQEMTFANDLLLKTRSAFNNAKVAGVADSETLDKYDKQIKDITDALKALAYDKDKKQELRDELFGYEDELSAALVVLEELGRKGSVTTDTQLEVLNALNSQYTAVNKDVTDLQNNISTKGEAAGTYGAAVAEEFGPKAQALADKLAAVKAAYEADGANVISNGDEFAYQMEEIANEYADLKAAWEPKQKDADKKYTSDTCYDKLVKELNNLARLTEYAHEQSFKYGMSGLYAAQYQHINNMIFGTYDQEGVLRADGETQKLEKLKKSYSITASTVLDPRIEQEVNVYVPNALYRIAGSCVYEEYSHVEDAIAGIQAPGVNEKGWLVRYHNVAEIVNSLTKEAEKIDKINPMDILQVKDADDNTVSATPMQAIENYEGIIDTLDTISIAVDGIVEDAQEEKYIKGDIDSDGDINVLDVQKLISLVGEGVNLEGKDKETADVNGDSDINVGDVTTLIDFMMGYKQDQYGTAMNRIRQYLPAVSGSNSIVVAEVTGVDGYRRYAVSLSNEVAFAAGQLDIVLPSHAKVAAVSLGERASALDTYVFENAESTRVIMTSLDNSLIEGNTGCVLYIDIEGDAEVEVENVIFSDINGNAYKIGNGTTAIDSIYDSIKDGVKSIYNAAGQKLRGLTKGVNIIRNADGTTTKRIGK